MSDYKLVDISVSLFAGEQKTIVGKDGKVPYSITIKEYTLSEAVQYYLDQGWKILGSDVGSNYVNLLLTR